MPDATITSTESTFGTISGVFAADQSTITGTITGVVAGTLDGSVGVPGPQGPTGAQGPQGIQGVPGPAGVGVPAGGTANQILAKVDGVDYNTAWVNNAASAVWGNITGTLSSQTDLQTALNGKYSTSNPAGYITSSALTPYLLIEDAEASFYPLTGNPSGFLTSASLSGYATESWVTSQGYLTSAPVTSVAGKTGAVTLAAGDISGLGSLAVVNDAPSDGSQYARKNGAWDVVTPASSVAWGDITGTLSDQTDLQTALDAKVSILGGSLVSGFLEGCQVVTTPAFGDNSLAVADTAFVQSALLGGTAVARNLEVEVRNQSGSTITAGSIVYISGATGNKPLITKAQANNDTNSAQTIGFTKTSIANNGTGFVIVRGELENIDTSALTEGVQLYLSPTTAGTWTTTKPSAPQHLVYVGIVIRSHPTQGTILVAVQNGYELDELHDVAALTPSNNDLLTYESATNLWKNKSFGTLGLLTSADLSGYATQSWVTSQGYITSSALSPYLLSSTAASTYQTLAGMSDYLSKAGNLAGLASTSTARSNLGLGSIATQSASSVAITGGTVTAGLVNCGIGTGGITFQSDLTTQNTAYPGSSGFLLKSGNLSGLADVSTARSNLGLGTMAIATAADYSTTSVANGLYYPLSSNPAGYLTSAPVTSVAGKTGAVSLVVADVSGAAPTASPALSGTPTAPTATAGTNTTQLATTAFVTGAVPAFATSAQARGFTSTTTAMSPRQAIWAMLSQDVVYVNRAGFNVTNVGTVTYVQGGWLSTVTRLGTAGACSSRASIFGTSQVDQTWNAESKSNTSGFLNFSLRKIFSGRSASDALTDPLITLRWSHGKANTDGVGDLVRRGFGWKFVGGTAPRYLTLEVHNGTTLTSVTSTFAPTSGIPFDWDIESDGAGNVTLYVNGTSVATSAAGPTGATNVTSSIWQEEAVASAAIGNPYTSFVHSRGRYVVINP